MDTIILLTDRFYYIVSYDDELDSLSEYQQIPITHLYAVDIGTCVVHTCIVTVDIGTYTYSYCRYRYIHVQLL